MVKAAAHRTRDSAKLNTCLENLFHFHVKKSSLQTRVITSRFPLLAPTLYHIESRTHISILHVLHIQSPPSTSLFKYPQSWRLYIPCGSVQVDQKHQCLTHSQSLLLVCLYLGVSAFLFLLLKVFLLSCMQTRESALRL